MTPVGFSDMCAGLLAEGRPVRFRASGSSMTPAIRDGDLLTVEPAGRRPFAEGDVVLYPIGGRFRAHRVLGFDPVRRELVCRGDAWFCRPEIVPEDSVVGVVAGLGLGATPAHSKRKLAAMRAGIRGRLGRVVRAAFRLLDSPGESC